MQPTSPFRKISTINEVCKIFLKNNFDSLISIEPIKHNHNPKYIFNNKKEFIKKTIKNLNKKKYRQSEDFFGLDGGVIFIIKTKFIKFLIEVRLGLSK